MTKISTQRAVEDRVMWAGNRSIESFSLTPLLMAIISYISYVTIIVVDQFVFFTKW